MPTADLPARRVLDGAGFACLEVSGGGVFDSAVRRGVESPWERIRALKARTRTPLGMALCGRFLVGSRPVGADFVRRFVASAAENDIDVFRLHDPLNDVSNLREAGEAIVGAGKEFHAGPVYSPGRGRRDALVEQSREPPELGATRRSSTTPTGGLEPHRVRASSCRASPRRPGSPSASTARAPGHGPRRLDRGRARRRRLIACAVYPLALSLHRVAGESLAEALDGMGLVPASTSTGCGGLRSSTSTSATPDHAAGAAARGPRRRVRPAHGPRGRARPADALPWRGRSTERGAG